ncbi:hypothetical protein CI109_107100 [Kwoniella shandongensis]|uniref:Ribosome biogenesis regulatory protein n=1 Tax=Kwoniella shandongensis TaxID=1734106 RepID=A0A5M6C5J9_9TREE|nr:uncharacterized protein CI109_002383 [Kwoniella shandongensis]KAA5529042.1 hypothetical protein CI109_002383 [Kwoniella shandongensis]
MDVTQELADFAAANSTAVLDRANPIITDAGLLAAFDNTPVDPEEYANLNPHLLALTLTSTQALISAIFTLPTKSSGSGPVVTLPTPVTLLPREKPLPKPKPPTKWERFAAAKGISHKKRDKDVWDDEKQEFVPRWGMGGKNREKEDQWLHEVKQGEGADLDPAKTARAERKARIAKNEKQHAANVSIAANAPKPISALRDPNAKPSSSLSDSQAVKQSSRNKRKAELERSMLISKTSTASLGRFDEKIDGEPKVKGVKRKFEPTVTSGGFDGEKEKALGVLKRVESTVGKPKKVKKGGEGDEGGLNVRKAVRFAGKQDGGKGKVVGKVGKGKRK